MAKAKILDHADQCNWLKPLWIIYGHAAFPQINCVILDKYQGVVNIWGYSVWKRSPGFRTLGTAFENFQRRSEILLFTHSQEEALDFLKNLTTPKPQAFAQIEEIKRRRQIENSIDD